MRAHKPGCLRRNPIVPPCRDERNMFRSHTNLTFNDSVFVCFSDSMQAVHRSASVRQNQCVERQERGRGKLVHRRGRLHYDKQGLVLQEKRL